MIVNDLDLGCSIDGPNEAQAPLSIDADAVLALSIVLQRFKTVPGRNLQVLKNCRPVQLCEFAKRGALDVHPAAHTLAFKEGFGVFAFEALDCHGCIVTCRVYSLKRDARQMLEINLFNLRGLVTLSTHAGRVSDQATLGVDA